jgi:tetratricopeptide (TPR) repeat protein
MRWVLAACLWFSVVRARAEPEAYRAAIDSAISEYELGNFAEARAQFLRAHELYPNARSFRGLGMSEFELRNYGEAIDQLERALAAKEKPLDEALRTQTEALLARAKAYTARIKLELSPARASVLVDGLPKEHPRQLTLAVGDHVLEFRAAGLEPQKRSLKVTGGEQRTLRIALDDTRHWYKSPWLWSGVAAVVAGSVTTALLLREPGQRLSDREGGTTGVSLPGPR